MAACLGSLIALTVLSLSEIQACGRNPSLGTIYDFNVTDIDGREIQLSKYRNKEPGTDQEIKQRVLAKYNITFDLFHKIDVNGDNAIPLYVFLKQSVSSWFSRNIEWNFVKFLVDRNGYPVSRYSSITSPNTMEPEIRKLLGLQDQQ
uniref:Glutathione peroxidase n=1 Tax=Trichobilharzia regenti TaxID=157069 RepID=A0AA85KAG4_TRIRE|nr:unnamed protein product [Trichobilharzia regenti]CAH8869882.1 unnamed protein product [Trichobilharzia regenti]